MSAQRPTVCLVCNVADLARSGAAQAEIDGVIVAMVRDGNGDYHALNDRAPTPTSRCPRARSTAAPSSAGCTARGSTFGPASPSGPPATIPSPSTP